MSEELQQVVPLSLGPYQYYRLGSTTLNQLSRAGIIPKRNYASVARKKPDGLVIDQGRIVATVEYKPPGTLSSEKALEKAIKQEIDVARALCRLLIITDGTQSFWVNALNGEPVLDSNGNRINDLFHPVPAKNTKRLAYLIGEIDASLTLDNSTIRKAQVLDPTTLAERLWQTIWVATGKSPVKCLYNVVELFIFKFLSDLAVLSDDIAFSSIRKKARSNPEEALQFYAMVSRKRIMQLFPEAEDGTTLIDGTIFVAENGEPNLSQAILFRRSLEHLHAYTEEFGSLTKIDKQFKTKLYESFLGQEVQALGQYFTPRAIVQSVIRMTGIDDLSFQFRGKRICDPFCGVGGFLLEILNLNENIRAQYFPTNAGKITPELVLHGFDKGFERDDERTIILAKANMLIYLAEILFANPTRSKELAIIFNNTFTLFRDNLGTFRHIIENEQDKYDLILSNPPYVTSGSGIIKEEIKENPQTAGKYPVSGLGLESLSVEWIVQSLRKGGNAFVIVPDGILGRVKGKKLRDYILRHCHLDAIVSLPVRTFFANMEHTYILAFTKKHEPTDIQTAPVFTYLVSHIGELLTSVKRTKIADNNLPEMEQLFRMFFANKHIDGVQKRLEAQSGRCKIQHIDKFKDLHWVIDRWWTREEKMAVGALEDAEFAEFDDVSERIAQFQALLNDYDAIANDAKLLAKRTRQVQLGDKALFRLFIGKRVLKKHSRSEGIPIYSANVFEPFAYLEESNVEDFSVPSILWGIDGNFDLNLLPLGVLFGTTDHCGTIQILSEHIIPEYLLYALVARRVEETFDRSFRPSLTNMRRFTVSIPVDKKGHFDVKEQEKIAERFIAAQHKRTEVTSRKGELDDYVNRYLKKSGLSLSASHE